MYVWKTQQARDCKVTAAKDKVCWSGKGVHQYISMREEGGIDCEERWTGI
jgi:hypothetical protein